MRRHRSAQVILPMLALPLLFAVAAMLVLPAAPSAGAGHPASAAASSSHGAHARSRHTGYFSLIPRSLMP